MALFEGFISGVAYIRRGLSTEGNLRFKIDWASLIVGSKFILQITKPALHCIALHGDNVESISRRLQKKLENEGSRETDERVSSCFPRFLSLLYSYSPFHYANMHF